MELGRVFGGELFCLCLFVRLFVCLFVFLFFQLLRWVIILFLSLTSGWGFLVFCFCSVLFFLQNVPFPHYISRVRLIFFSVSPVGKLFLLSFVSACLLAFILFCFVFSLFFFSFFFLCFQKFHPPLKSKYGAPFFVILLHKWWWTLRHRQFWIPVTCLQFSEKSNFNLKLH